MLPGHRVRITQGPHAGEQGVVLNCYGVFSGAVAPGNPVLPEWKRYCLVRLDDGAEVHVLEEHLERVG